MLPLLFVLYSIGTTLFVKGIEQYKNKQMKLLHTVHVLQQHGKGLHKWMVLISAIPKHPCAEQPPLESRNSVCLPCL